jgi:ribosome biogenesis protein MAK21
MKTVIIREMTALIMRPTPLLSLSTPRPHIHKRFHSGSGYETKREKNAWRAHARYYAAITFNQIVLSTSEADRGAVRTLIDVYFQLFREVVDEQEPQSVDDVVPMAEGTKVMRTKKNPKGHRAHSHKSKQVRGAAGFAEVQDSNAKLLGAILTGINRALPYAQFKGENVQ